LSSFSEFQERHVNTLTRNTPTLLALAVGLALAHAADAQVASPRVVISNTSPQAEIGLEAGSNVEFAANGDLQIRCRKTGDSCVTANIGSGPVPPNAPTGLVLTPSATTLTAGNPFNLQWTSTNADACFGVGPANVSGWTNQVLTTTRGAPGLALTLAQGTYAFQMRCYNAGGAASITAPTVTVNENTNPPPPNFCQEHYASGLPTGSQFNAHGFTRVDVAYQSVWNADPGFSSGVTAGVPGNFIGTSANRYMAIPFVLPNDSGSQGVQVSLLWAEAQGVGIGTGAVTVTISPCAGDFRAPVVGSPDIYLDFQCRAAASIGGELRATSLVGLAGCRAPKGKQMFINIATYNMFVPTPPTESTCSGLQTCGVAMRLN